MGFTPLDYLVLFLYLIATASLGTFLGRGQKNIEDYFLGGKQMPWWAISLSIVATETSTLTFIGAPAIAYGGDLTFLQIVAGYLIGKVLVSLILIPGYFQGQIQTAYEVLNVQFGSAVRTFSAVLFQVTRTLADGVRLFATALVLSVVTQISDVWTVVIIGLVTIVYTFYGGMRAVVWNDVIQLAIYLLGAAVALFMIVERVPGGWEEIIRVAGPEAKLRFLDLSRELSVPYTLWAGLIGGAFLTFATHGTDQMMVQRYLACGTPRKSQVALIISGIVVFFQFLLFLVIGVLLYAFYQHFPLGRELEQVDRIFPIFIVEQMPPGISGLIIAAIFAAAMSTLSSSLNSLASSSVNDFYRAYFVREGSEDHYLRISRVFTLGWGILLILVSMLARNWGEVLPVGLTIASVTMGSVLGIFLLGLLPGRTSQRAGLAGMGTGLAVMIWVSQLPYIAWPWYVFIGTAITFSTGATLTLFSNRVRAKD